MKRIRVNGCKVVSLWVVLFLLSGCGVRADRAITEQGAGRLNFTDPEPEFPGYIVTSEVQADDYEPGDDPDSFLRTVVEVREETGDLLLRRTGDQLIEVFSPRYKTREGVSVGMTLKRALKRLKLEEPEFYNPWPTREFIFEKEMIGFVLSADDLVEEPQADDGSFLSSKEVGAHHFPPDARIVAIRIRRP